MSEEQPPEDAFVAPPGGWPEVMSLELAARFLGVKPRSLSDHASAGRVPARKIGRAWRFSRLALHDWLAGRIEAVADRE